jgi:molybdenum cofactor cytidylyltransferase
VKLKSLSLSKAIGISGGDVVSLVGGGGKSTIMFLLAKELAAKGLRIIITTTTHIFPHEAPFKTIFKTGIQDIKDEININRLIVLAEGYEGEKLKGIDPSKVEELKKIAEVILVEADGANRRPFKAPLDHEPVIPHSSTIVSPVVGLDVVGKILSSENCHRPERIAELMNINIGDIITTDIVAKTILHPKGGVKDVPAKSRVVPILNKADSPGKKNIAGKIVKDLTRRGIKRAIITSLKSEPLFIKPGGENCNVMAVILAAGASSRMGRSKLDLKIKDRTLIQMVLDSTASSLVDGIIMVTRPGFIPVNESLYPQFKIVENEKWETGQSSSMRKGLENIKPGMDAVIFLMADQPFVNTDIINELLLRYYDTGSALVAPVYKGERGSPVIFDRSLFQELLAIEGDKGGRELLDRFPVEYVEFDSSLPGMDIDAPEDYEKLKDFVGNDI